MHMHYPNWCITRKMASCSSLEIAKSVHSISTRSWQILRFAHRWGQRVWRLLPNMTGYRCSINGNRSIGGSPTNLLRPNGANYGSSIRPNDDLRAGQDGVRYPSVVECCN